MYMCVYLMMVAVLQTLWAKRDFKLINGVIIKSPVTCIKYVNQSE